MYDLLNNVFLFVYIKCLQLSQFLQMLCDSFRPLHAQKWFKKHILFISWEHNYFVCEDTYLKTLLTGDLGADERFFSCFVLLT